MCTFAFMLVLVHFFITCSMSILLPIVLFITLASFIILKNANRLGCNWLIILTHRSSCEHDGHTKGAEPTAIWLRAQSTARLQRHEQPCGPKRCCTEHVLARLISITMAAREKKNDTPQRNIWKVGICPWQGRRAPPFLMSHLAGALRRWTCRRFVMSTASSE